ncbi:hypothetical protein [Pontibacter chitinilyticus]|uniref:hypothetical protein n=1 Tax=Pontibacter chitinilyticus TaxID=2674989 RepID=UPI00321A3305
MRRFLAIGLLLLYLLSATEFNQLLKLPVLVEHFREHRHANPNLSIAQYLQIHYLSGNVRDPDYPRDQQLPFKACDHYLGNAAVYTVPLFQPYFTLAPPRDARTYHVVTDEAFRLSQYLSTIWQPPKTA